MQGVHAAVLLSQQAGGQEEAGMEPVGRAVISVHYSSVICTTV